MLFFHICIFNLVNIKPLCDAHPANILSSHVRQIFTTSKIANYIQNDEISIRPASSAKINLVKSFTTI
jgi:hypothetical protein